MEYTNDQKEPRLIAEARWESDPKARGREVPPTLFPSPGSGKEGAGQGRGSTAIRQQRETAHLPSGHQMKLIVSFLGQGRPTLCQLGLEEKAERSLT